MILGIAPCLLVFLSGKYRLFSNLTSNSREKTHHSPSFLSQRFATTTLGCHSATSWTGVFKNKSNAIHLKPLIKDYFKKYLEYNTAYLQQYTVWHTIFACFTRETCSCHRKPLIKINNCCFCLTRGLICRNGVLPTTSRRRWRMRKRV